MTEKTFQYKLRRGLGSAIIELQENPDRAKYRDIVLRCCLKNIGYDVQCEGTKGYYLYTAICALGVKDEFEDILINAFMRRLEHCLFQQLKDILRMYAVDGSLKAQNAIDEKCCYFREHLPKQRAFPFRFCEREQFEDLMITQVDANKWPAFKKCVHDAGMIMSMRKDDACSCYDWFLCHCENIFGKKRIWQYLETSSESSKAIRAFVDGYRELERAREKNSRLRIETEVTLDSYIERARELENNQYAYTLMHRTGIRFSRQASQEDLLELGLNITQESSDRVRANMLRVFRNIDFPGDIELLMMYTQSDCERLHDTAIDALERFKDDRVHNFAVKLLTEGNLEAGLPLLITNWRKSDEKLIRKQVLSKRVTHFMQMSLRDIYLKHRSNSCGDILEYIYEKGECTYCRSRLVEIMVKNHVIKENILRECQFDSYDDTRRLAVRLTRRHLNVVGIPQHC